MHALSRHTIRPWALLGALALAGFAPVATARAETGDTVPAPSQSARPSEPSDQSQPSTPPGPSGAVPGTLSGELSRSDGVIAPPHTGDAAVVPPPNQGISRTPVIPAPGTPGGNPAIQPK